MSDNEKLILGGLLLLFLWKRSREDVDVRFPEDEVWKECPGGHTVPYNEPCPPTN